MRDSRITKDCVKCGTPFKVYPSLMRVTHCSISCSKIGKPGPRRGAVLTDSTKQKQREAKLGIRGKDHWNWRGGKRSERKKAMARDEYIQWRKQVFERDGFKCQWCGEGGSMHADHIQPWSTHIELRFDVDNGRTLCVPCHHKTPSFPKKLIPKELRI